MVFMQGLAIFNGCREFRIFHVALVPGVRAMIKLFILGLMGCSVQNCQCHVVPALRIPGTPAPSHGLADVIHAGPLCSLIWAKWREGSVVRAGA